MIRPLIFIFSSLILTACGGEPSDTGGSGNPPSTPNQPEPDNGGDGNTDNPTPSNLSLTLNGSELDDNCQFSDSQLRGFFPLCDLTISVDGLSTSAQLSEGQFSSDMGETWQDLAIADDSEFTLPLEGLSDEIWIRAHQQVNDESHFSDVTKIDIVENSIAVSGNSGSFSLDRNLNIADGQEQFSFTLPNCSDAQNDATEVEVKLDGELWFVQQPLADVEFASNLVDEGAVISTVCRDKLARNVKEFEAQQSAPGRLTITKGGVLGDNQAPVASFQDIDALRFSGQLRDKQEIELCFNAIDPDNDTLSSRLSYQLDGSGEVLLSTNNNCAKLSLADHGDDRLSISLSVSDGQDTTQIEQDLGVIYRDTLSIASSENSSCVLGEQAVNVALTVSSDRELDPASISLFNISNNTVIKELGSLRSQNISFACDVIGETRYVIRTKSRGLEKDSLVYSHSVTNVANNLPLVNIKVPEGDLVGLTYRDNQDLKVCIDETDLDSADALNLSLSYQYDQQTKSLVNLDVDKCANISTQGRGGQHLVVFADVNDGSATVNASRDLGMIHSDTIQFASSLSNSCVEGDSDLSYQINVNADSEGDTHQLTIFNAQTNSNLGTLGALTSGDFNLSCGQVGSSQFYINNTSRGLSADSAVYTHTVLAAANLAPNLSVNISGERVGSAYRDQQDLNLCFDSVDPEGEPTSINASYRFSNDAFQALSLDSNNCADISTLNRGGQNFAISANSTDGEVSTSLDEDYGAIYTDTIQVAFSSSNNCTVSTSSLTYTVSIPNDLEGDGVELDVFDATTNTLIAPLGDSAPFQFSMSCNAVGSTDFYIRNQSRNLTTLSMNYQHRVDDLPNQAPEVEIAITGVEQYDGRYRDNQTFTACINESDADGDSLTSQLSYEFDSEGERTVVLNNNCAIIDTQGQGDKTLTLRAVVNDGRDESRAELISDIYRDTVQFPHTFGQTCRIGDVHRAYNVTVQPDVENDSHLLEVYNADTNQLIENLGNATSGTFSLSCAAGGLTNFYVKNTSRGIASQSVIYQHNVSNVVNDSPTINLALTQVPQYQNLVRDNQVLQVCATVGDVNNDTLTTQIFYQFDNEPQQQVSLANLCGSIDVSGQGNKSLVIQGFVGDGTATTNDTLTLGLIHQDTVQTAISSSSSCRIGDGDRSYSVLVAADFEGDPYSIDVYDVNTDQVLASLGQVVAGNFALPCDSQRAINFSIRTTSRGQTRDSLIYSHIVSDTLNSAPTVNLLVNSGEQSSGAYRDNQSIEVCIEGSDPDGDDLTLSASYRFAADGFTSLSLNGDNCGVINTAGQGGNTLIAQAFASDGQIETSMFLDLGEIQTDTIQLAQTVSSECTLGESALRYSVFVPTDVEGDAHDIRVVDQNSDSVIAELGGASQSEFTLDCASLGIRSFTLVNNSRGLQTESEIYTHTVNPTLTNTVATWLTTHDKDQLLAAQTDNELKIGTGTATLQVDVSDVNEYQKIESFGATLTDSAASLIFNSDNRGAIMAQLFNMDTGIGISGIRYPLAGMSEFVSRVANSYNDRPAGLTDPDLTFFSINADRDFLLPILQDALVQSPDIDVMATNWSAPAWMKVGDSLQGGEIRTEFFESYSNYLFKFFDAYRDEGVKFTHFSLQNQPHEESNFPSQAWTSQDYIQFLSEHLEPQLRRAAIFPRYIFWDGNWTDNNSQQAGDIATFAKAALNSAKTRLFSYGSAWQCYQADNGFADYSQAFVEIKLAASDKKIILSECGNVESGQSFGDILSGNVGDMFIGSLRNHVSSIYYNSLALDENNGPNQGGCSNCRGVVTIDTNGNMNANAEYFALAHFSQFIKPGAVRIDSTNFDNQLNTVAFKNEDDSVVMVVSNRTAAALSFDVNWQGQFFNYSLPEQSVVSFKWDSSNAPIANAQQVAQASDIARETFLTIQQMRDSNSGLYRAHYDLVGGQNADYSPGATGYGLVAMSIAYSMGWLPNAPTDVLTTLTSINELSSGRNDLGMLKSRFNVTGGNSNLSEYSVIETSQLLAGATIVANVFSFDEDIQSQVTTLLGSVDWTGAVTEASTGMVAMTQTSSGSAVAQQGVYGSQMLSAWFAYNAGDIAAIQLWDQYYESGEAFQRFTYKGLEFPANEQGNAINSTIHQSNFYLINAALSSANYRSLMKQQGQAEKQYWADNFSEPSFIWGYGFGVNDFASQSPNYDSVDSHAGNIAHAPTIAGYLVTDLSLLDDFLSWPNNNIGIVNTQVGGLSIPWRYSADTPAWQPSTIEMEGLITQLMGLASHPGLLDISYFRSKTLPIED